jgi:CRP-like cAMP-binding protein
VVVDSSRIAAFPDFADLPEDELAVLAASMTEIEVDAGANVITVDDYGTALYFVEQGDADVLKEGGDANQGVGPGDVFGEIGLLLTGQRTATVVALTPMRLLSLSGQDFDRIRAGVPEVERTLRRLGLERTG